MKLSKIVIMFCLYSFSVLPNAFCVENADEAKADANYSIVSIDGSGAPNAVLSSSDTDISLFERADGFTADQKPIKNDVDNFTIDQQQIKRNPEK